MNNFGKAISNLFEERPDMREATEYIVFVHGEPTSACGVQGTGLGMTEMFGHIAEELLGALNESSDGRASISDFVTYADMMKACIDHAVEEVIAARVQKREEDRKKTKELGDDIGAALMEMLKKLEAEKDCTRAEAVEEPKAEEPEPVKVPKKRGRKPGRKPAKKAQE